MRVSPSLLLCHAHSNCPATNATYGLLLQHEKKTNGYTVCVWVWRRNASKHMLSAYCSSLIQAFSHPCWMLYGVLKCRVINTLCTLCYSFYQHQRRKKSIHVSLVLPFLSLSICLCLSFYIKQIGEWVGKKIMHRIIRLQTIRFYVGMCVVFILYFITMCFCWDELNEA